MFGDVPVSPLICTVIQITQPFDGRLKRRYNMGWPAALSYGKAYIALAFCVFYSVHERHPVSVNLVLSRLYLLALLFCHSYNKSKCEKRDKLLINFAT